MSPSDPDFPTGDQVAEFAKRHLVGFELAVWQQQVLEAIYAPPRGEEVVYVVTDMGAGDEPARLVNAELGRMRRVDGRWTPSSPSSDRVWAAWDGTRDGEVSFIYYDETQTFTACSAWPRRPPDDWTVR